LQNRSAARAASVSAQSSTKRACGRPRSADGVFPSPSPGAVAHHLAKGPVEGGLIGKSGLQGDIDEDAAGVAHEILGPIDPAQDEPAVSRNAEARFERPREMAHRHAALLRDPGQMEAPVEVSAQKLRGPAFLPDREPLNCDFRQSRQPAVRLKQMRAKQQAELIEREKAGPVRRHRDRENVLGQLCDDQIVFADRELYVPIGFILWSRAISSRPSRGT
jgi:hypothetical protein